MQHKLSDWFLYFFIFSLGAIIGSFLNVVIHRIPRRESIAFPNSRCPHCKNPVKPYDNIPIISWLVLKGKCRSCKNPISPRYIIVESVTASLFLVAFLKLGLSPFLLPALVLICATIALIFIDAEHMILPTVITYPMIIVALISRILFALFFADNFFSDLKYFPAEQISHYPVWFSSLLSGIFGSLVGGGFLWITGQLWEKLRKIEAMGMGDVKMMAGVGAFLGWRLTLLTIFIGAFTGALAGIGIAWRKGSLQTHIPFGIFLGIGTIISLLFGEELIRLYLDLFMP
jgi:leader peptidase (prepilin peptidase)/N-methyltransferase